MLKFHVLLVYLIILTMETINLNGISVNDLLKLIPEDLLVELSSETKVDYQVKKLYGRNVFTLLLFGLVESERLGLRSLQDFYNSTHYKVLFNVDQTKTTRYNSLSARLATMNVDFFKKAFEAIYDECSHLYDQTDLSLNYQITRVDSTMVCQTATQLEKGINVGCKKDGKKQVKYTICLTNLFPSSVEVFREQCHINENYTIPQAILKVIDKNKDNVFVFDRSQNVITLASPNVAGAGGSGDSISGQISSNDMSNESEKPWNTTSSSRKPSTDPSERTKWQIERCEIITPFGRPVEPDV